MIHFSIGNEVNSLLFALHCGQLLSVDSLALLKYVGHQKHLSHKMNIGTDDGVKLLRVLAIKLWEL